MNRREFLGLFGGSVALVCVGCNKSNQPTMLDLLAQQKGMEFFVEERTIDGHLSPYVVGIKADGETRYEDRHSGYSWLFYVGSDANHRVLVDKPPSEYVVPAGQQVYAAYEPWQILA